MNVNKILKLAEQFEVYALEAETLSEKRLAEDVHGSLVMMWMNKVGFKNVQTKQHENHYDYHFTYVGKLNPWGMAGELLPGMAPQPGRQQSIATGRICIKPKSILMFLDSAPANWQKKYSTGIGVSGKKYTEVDLYFQIGWFYDKLEGEDMDAIVKKNKSSS